MPVTVSPCKPRLVELVGPAGAGKSTVFQALLARDETIEGRPSLRKTEHAAVLASDVLAVLGTLVRYRAFLSAIKPEQVRMMAYLQALPRILGRADSGDGRIIVFDQGPVYFLTRPSLMDERLSTWRERVLDTWASLLNVVVRLEAPNALLVERINSRSKWHALKGSPDQTALDVLTNSRAVYDRAISEFQGRRGGPTILRFDTSSQSADEIADAVLAALDDSSTFRSHVEPQGTASRRGPSGCRSGDGLDRP
jgi:hypothetical protein